MGEKRHACRSGLFFSFPLSKYVDTRIHCNWVNVSFVQFYSHLSSYFVKTDYGWSILLRVVLTVRFSSVKVRKCAVVSRDSVCSKKGSKTEWGTRIITSKRQLAPWWLTLIDVATKRSILYRSIQPIACIVWIQTGIGVFIWLDAQPWTADLW